jgi:hypothetical protein
MSGANEPSDDDDDDDPLLDPETVRRGWALTTSADLVRARGFLATSGALASEENRETILAFANFLLGQDVPAGPPCTCDRPDLILPHTRDANCDLWDEKSNAVADKSWWAGRVGKYVHWFVPVEDDLVDDRSLCGSEAGEFAEKVPYAITCSSCLLAVMQGA